MQNARKGVVTAYSEMGRKGTTTQTPRRLNYNKQTDSDSELNKKLTNKENRKSLSDENNFNSIRKFKNNNSDQNIYKSAKTSRRLDEITALTHETLARVDNLVNKREKCDGKANSKSSILKKKSIDEGVVEEIVPNPIIPIPSGPVSILKRKVSTDETRHEVLSSTPVTFSPSVVEPSTTNRKQGILKKRRSLDESQVLRHRSCSPEVAANKSDSRSILKSQRRSSLEEIVRTQSPDTSIQGILKRRTSRNEEEYDHSLSSPQSILKRRSGASSAGSSSGTPHVSITTAVILAAAGGAEMILENETVRPILKKKSLDEVPFELNQNESSLKPILKKKSSTDTDDAEERPKPILKLPREHEELRYHQNSLDSGSECDVKPILKQREELARPRLSFCREDNFVLNESSDGGKRNRNFKRPNTICTDFNIRGTNDGVEKEDDRDLRKPRPLSVFELARKFETNISTGAIPKKSSAHKRNNDRSRTQPVTYNEFEAR